jgi:hypothetical protein
MRCANHHLGAQLPMRGTSTLVVPEPRLCLADALDVARHRAGTTCLPFASICPLPENEP